MTTTVSFNQCVLPKTIAQCQNILICTLPMTKITECWRQKCNGLVPTTVFPSRESTIEIAFSIEIRGKEKQWWGSNTTVDAHQIISSFHHN